ncbi:MAG: transketolase [Deltaproteobacteria bacterium]|nr:transketolase [Deltaproteobacteria bacterium]MBI3075958.1 transketolase [Deltaproteobacteria bacterium]
MSDAQEVARLQEIARQVRIDILKMLHKAGSGHTGGSLSAVELLVSLYFHKLRHRPADPQWPDRDRLLFSKGHGAPALYAVLARCGYYPAEEMQRLRKLGGILQGHPDRMLTPGVEISAGSLGHGLAMANGMALAARLDGKPYRFYVMMSDGECQEGEVWEAAMASAHYRLDSICVLLDRNHIQNDDFMIKIRDIEPIRDKWAAFGWNVLSIDGHDFPQILKALDEAEACRGRPSIIVAETVKGKGASPFENSPKHHGVSPTDAELEQALKELGAQPEGGGRRA